MSIKEAIELYNQECKAIVGENSFQSKKLTVEEKRHNEQVAMEYLMEKCTKQQLINYILGIDNGYYTKIIF